jgi:micrococcal nuclease
MEIEGRRERVRYIGINTPETKHPTRGVEPYGPEAADANTRLVAGQTVHLELDVERRDRYERLLAYVYVGDTMINAELVRQGYAQVATSPPNVKYQGLFLKLQREAREAGRGLWRAR